MGIANELRCIDIAMHTGQQLHTKGNKFLSQSTFHVSGCLQSDLSIWNLEFGMIERLPVITWPYG